MMLRDKTGSHISGKVSNGLLAGLLWTLENEICSFKLACIQSCEYIYMQNNDSGFKYCCSI